MNSIQYIVALCVGAAIAFPLHMRPIEDPHASGGIFLSSRGLQRREVCELPGNPDLYGLGVRLGVYTQLTSSLLANNYHEELLKDVWDTVSDCIIPRIMVWI
jgi:hypothetical protein